MSPFLGAATAKGGEILVSEAFLQQLQRAQKGGSMPACERFAAGTNDTKFLFFRCK